MSLRIIGGTWRSRRLHRPETPGTRPMPDRLKQSIFNILGNWYATPGYLPALSIADVFAGSGSMGLEALSRGASSCVFYEHGRLPVESLRRNIDSLGANPVCEVVTQDAWTSAACDTRNGRFDLIFLDPPYRDTEDPSASGRVFAFLERAGRGSGSRLPMVVLHHQSKISFADAGSPALWDVFDQRNSGTSAVTFFRPRVGELRNATNP